MCETKMIFNVPEFTGENVPVSVAAKVMKKDQQFIRQGMIKGLLPIGTVFKKDGSEQYGEDLRGRHNPTSVHHDGYNVQISFNE